MAPGTSTWWETGFLLEKTCSPDNIQFSGKSFIRTWLPGEAVVLLSWWRAMPSQWHWFILNVTALKCRQLGAPLDTLSVNQLSLAGLSGTTVIQTNCKSTPLCSAFILNRKGEKKKKEPMLQSPGSFLQVLTPVIICKSSSTAAPNNQSRSTNQSQAPCTTSKAPLKEGFDDTAGRSPGWHRPLLVLMCLHSLLITSNILLEQPRPKWAFNQAPDTGRSAVPTLWEVTKSCWWEWCWRSRSGIKDPLFKSWILPTPPLFAVKPNCSTCNPKDF